MDHRKKHYAQGGMVASAQLGSMHAREVFFQVDPMTLDVLESGEPTEQLSTPEYFDIDPEPFLQFLPELEAEIYFLIWALQKSQKDIAELVHVSQPTVSYRYRRAEEKLQYLMTITSVPLRQLLEQLDFLKPHEVDVLYDLFYHCNQEFVGKQHGMRQSSVKWIFVKTKKKLKERELTDESWTDHYGLMLLLERNLGIRVTN